jgi:hypothetical protein
MLFTSLIGCTIVHELSNRLPMKRWSNVRHRGNLIASMVFQIYFVTKAAYLIYLEHHGGATEFLQEETFQQLRVFIGYFIYDLCYLIQTDPSSGYVLHHLVAIGMLSVLCSLGLPRLDLLSYYNQLCFVTEVTNPITTLRHFTKGSNYERCQRVLMFLTYTIFRVFLYPLLSYRLMPHLQHPSLVYLFLSIYGMSLVWYRRILHMTFSSSKS